MNKKLYIGNLSDEVTEQDLKHNFSAVGKVVSTIIIKDRYSNRRRGFGFVEMETEEAAREAITQFNGGDLRGKAIVVSEAKEKKVWLGTPPGSGRPGSGFSRGPGRRGGRY